LSCPFQCNLGPLKHTYNRLHPPELLLSLAYHIAYPILQSIHLQKGSLATNMLSNFNSVRRSNVNSRRWAALFPRARGVAGKAMPPHPPSRLFDTRGTPPIRCRTHRVQGTPRGRRGPVPLGHASQTARTSSLRLATMGLAPPGTMCGGRLPIMASRDLSLSRAPAPGRFCTAAFLQGPSRGMQACQSPLPTGSACTHLWGAPL
jgi:hypothetical protein